MKTELYKLLLDNSYESIVAELALIAREQSHDTGILDSVNELACNEIAEILENAAENITAV